MQSILPSLPPTDALVWGLVSAFIVAVVIGWLVVTPFNRLLRRRVPWVKEENLGKGVPSWFTGMFERFVFAGFVIVFPSPTVVTAMMAWLALKMAAGWNKGGRQQQTPAEQEFWDRHSFIA